MGKVVESVIHDAARDVISWDGESGQPASDIPLLKCRVKPWKDSTTMTPDTKHVFYSIYKPGTYCQQHVLVWILDVA